MCAARAAAASATGESRDAPEEGFNRIRYSFNEIQPCVGARTTDERIGSATLNRQNNVEETTVCVPSVLQPIQFNDPEGRARSLA